MKKINFKSHVGRPTNEEILNRKKKNIIKWGLIAIFIIFCVGFLYLLVNNDFKLDSIMGNSSTINKAIFSPNAYKGDLYYYKNNSEAIRNMYKKALGNNKFNQLEKGKWGSLGISVYYNGKLIKSFRPNETFYIHKKYKGKTLTLHLDYYRTFSKYSTTHETELNLYVNIGYYKINNQRYHIIPNTAILKNYVKSNKLYQGAKKEWGDSCLGFSQAYAAALYKKDFSLLKNQPGLVRGNDANTGGLSFSERSYEIESSLLKEIYNQLKKSKPVVVQVNGNVDGTSRHYSVIVGIKTTANYKSLKESDFLLFDVWDGEIEQLNGKGNKNGLGNSSRFFIRGRDTIGYKEWNDKMYNYGYQIYVIK